MIRRYFILFTLVFVFFLAKTSFAAFSLIRDAETEKFLRELSNPIFKTAGLNSKNIDIYIINDSSINAFVSGGQNVFLNTGLIRKYNTPDALIGVVAHETGHIAAGHLARSSEGADQAGKAVLLSYILGLGAAVAGSPDAGMAIIAGGSNSANRLYMKFTRNQEEAADQHAIKYLGNLAYPSSGLVRLLEFFESRLIGYKDQIDEYLLSHPVSRKRIDLIKERTKHQNFSDKKINKKLQRQMDVILAKLEGFIENPDYLIEKYQNQSNSRANYIKSIAFFRKGLIPQSLKLLNPIIENSRSNKSEIGFLWELKGQILFESGDIENSIIAYDKSLKFLSNQDSAQIKIAFASAILVLKNSDNDLLKLAIKKLQEAQIFEKYNPFLFKQLSNAYFKIGEEGRSFLALAEYNFLIDKKKKCRKYAKIAKEKLDKSAKAELLRADDLLELAKKKEKE